jgi:hypothetical protein
MVLSVKIALDNVLAVHKCKESHLTRRCGTLCVRCRVLPVCTSVIRAQLHCNGSIRYTLVACSKRYQLRLTYICTHVYTTLYTYLWY